MDKQLKELDFEKKINVTFTEENKRNVLNKIQKVEQKKMSKPHYLQNALTFTFTIGLIFFGYTMFANNDVQESAEDSTQLNNQTPPNSGDSNAVITSEVDKEHKQLKVSAKYSYWDPITFTRVDTETNKRVEYDFSDPNYNLFAAHLKAAAITENTIFMGAVRGNEIPTHTIYIKYLNEILLLLGNIEPSQENLEELTQAKQITQRVLDEEISKRDPILDELHMILHDLDEYYNVKPFKDNVMTQDGLQVLLPDETED
ncbi:polyphosphate kinase [Solibacillus sp. R5-41]|uniref:polyphosphate kinase n=1 Tax=Solibacillus sp. R5-41 TaxID=2048654 RepID=UPI000C1296D0|nr:polyphosphate kinase [Solibacillus sp. R5-41]ATP40868.1 polyphosphate kinase [Solibacillus sp. R5-41]